jgi:3-oxoacyl-[acyl-carrier protein] reductase
MTEANSRPIALVTGGTRGIGRAISLRLAADGYHVIANYKSRLPEAEETCRLILDAGGEATAVQADVTVKEDVQRLFNEIRSLRRPLRVLINNAGRLYEALFALTPADQFFHIMQANLMGAVLCSQAAIRLMLAEHRGSIINISSTASLRAPLGLSAYAASKAALNSLTRTMARELVSKGIRVNAVAPSWTETEMIEGANLEAVREAARRLPLGRLNTPEEIATAVSMLVRDDMTAMIGQVVPLDGGGA